MERIDLYAHGKEAALIELKRKSIHMIPGFLAYPILVFLGRTIGLWIAVLFFFLYLWNELYIKGFVPYEAPITTKTYQIMARKEEIEKRHFMGALYFWGFAILIIYFLNPLEAVIAITIASFGDAVAAIIGRYLHKPKIPWNPRKSIFGSLAMLIISVLICTLLGLELKNGIFISSMATLAESLPQPSVIDEVTVPGILLLLFFFIV